MPRTLGLAGQKRLWRIMRYEETTNTYYESFEEPDLAVFKRSSRWKPKKDSIFMSSYLRR
jgi:hypothetical protein